MGYGSDMVREPAVAGRFYPGTPTEIAGEVHALFAGAPTTEERALAVMCPHAGWVYSGKLAAKTLAQVHVPDRVVVMCPNHTGLGARIAVGARGGWRMPGVDVPIDEPLADAILREAAPLRASADDSAHAREHAIEVLIPLLLARQPALRLVPIVLGHLDVDECSALGAALARAIGDQDVLVVASSDMSHYLPDAECRRRDRLALEALVTGDPAALLGAVAKHDVSMCGVRPAAAMLAYARARGGPAPRLVGYATSGDAFGDRSRVVGYAGAVIGCAGSQ